MHPTRKIPPYSYLVRWSEKDREFVATFLELPDLSGLAPTIPGAVKEARIALDAWINAAREQGFEIPEASMQSPCMILDGRFGGYEPVMTWDILEDFVVIPDPEAETESVSSRAVFHDSRVPA